MASSFRQPNRVQFLCKGHKILNVLFGILIGSLAVLRRYTTRADFDSSAILMCLVDFSMHVLVCVLPQSIISIYCFLRKGRCADLEAYILTGAMVLDDYVALLMINIEYIRIVMIPGMIIVFIGTLAWKLRKSRIVEVGSSKMDHDRANTVTTEKQNNKEEIFYVENTNSSDKLELFEFVSYILQLSLVTWTQYKGQQGSTPVLSDFLLFLCSVLGALGTMLASPLAGVNSRAVSAEVLPVLQKTCIVVLFIAVHTLAAEWLGNDMIYVCLPELITVLVWFMVWFGESTRVSTFTLYEYQIAIFNSVVGALYLYPLMYWKNLRVSLIMWSFRISISSASFSEFHAWLLHGWPGSSSESKKLISLLGVCASACYGAAVTLCVYTIVVTNPWILYKEISSSEDATSLYEVISSFQDEAVAAVMIIISVLTVIIWFVRCRTKIHTEIRIIVKRTLELELHRNPEDESKEILDQKMTERSGITTAKRSQRQRSERDYGTGGSKIATVSQRRKSSSPVRRYRNMIQL
ncbi:hypothetical protein D1007_59558 [Hordeum vulgare]|nr:hypothetical protein D1007_59558 [Hordeum vulgare]